MTANEMAAAIMAAQKAAIAAMCATPPQTLSQLYGSTLSAAGISFSQGARTDEGYFSFTNGVVLHVQYYGQTSVAGGSFVTTGIYYDNAIDGWIYGSNGQWGHFKIVV